MASSHSSTANGERGPHCSSWPLVGRDEALGAVTAAIGRPGPGSAAPAEAKESSGPLALEAGDLAGERGQLNFAVPLSSRRPLVLATNGG